MIITGNSNEYIKHLKKLQTKKQYRTEQKSFVVEGLKPVCESLQHAKKLIISENFDMSQIDRKIPCEKVFVSQSVFEKISETKTPQGIMAEVAAVDCPLEEITGGKTGLVIFCDRVSDPGNLGTIIRTADAAGFDGVVLNSGCVDLYNPKTVRSTMASVFNIKIHITENSEEAINALKQGGYTVFGSRLEESDSVFEAPFEGKSAIIVGNEAQGIDKIILTMCDKYVKIPMLGKAESLNVGAASAVLMYEALRRRL